MTPVHGDLSAQDHCVGCAAGLLRPDVVWFGEMPRQMDRVERALFDCEIFISIGTSGHVYPAAGFVEIARHAGARTIELNLEPSQSHNHFDESVRGPASQIVPAFVESLLAS